MRVLTRARRSIESEISAGERSTTRAVKLQQTVQRVAGDTSVERVCVSTPAPLETGDTTLMQRELAALEVQDVLKVFRAGSGCENTSQNMGPWA